MKIKSYLFVLLLIFGVFRPALAEPPQSVQSWLAFLEITADRNVKNESVSVPIGRFYNGIDQYTKLTVPCRKNSFFPYMDLYFTLKGNYFQFKDLFKSVSRFCGEEAENREEQSAMIHYQKKEMIEDFREQPLNLNFESKDSILSDYNEKLNKIYISGNKALVHPYRAILFPYSGNDPIRGLPTVSEFVQMRPARQEDSIKNADRMLEHSINQSHIPDKYGRSPDREKFEWQAFANHRLDRLAKMLPYATKSVARMKKQSALPRRYHADLDAMLDCARSLEGFALLRLLRTLNYFRLYGNPVIAGQESENESEDYIEYRSGIQALLYRQKSFEIRTNYVKSVLCGD